MWRALSMVLAFSAVQSLCMLGGMVWLTHFIGAGDCSLNVGLLAGSPMVLGIVIWLYTIFTCLLFAVEGWWKPRATLTVRFDRRAFVWLLPFALSAVYIVTWLSDRLALSDNMQDYTEATLATSWGLVAVIGWVPLCEEVVFRAGLMQTLLRCFTRPWLAVGVSAVVFAIVHGNPVQYPPALLMGVLLGWLYWRSQSLWPSVLMHAFNNGLAVLTWWLLPESDVRLTDLPEEPWMVVAGLVLSVVVLAGSWFRLHRLFGNRAVSQEYV